jgi:acyl carrier protein
VRQRSAVASRLPIEQALELPRVDDMIMILREYVLEQHLPGESAANLKDHTRLQSSGILDSMAVLEMAAFIHQRFGVELSATETSIEVFDRLKDIAALVERRRAEGTVDFPRAS